MTILQMRKLRQTQSRKGLVCPTLHTHTQACVWAMAQVCRRPVGKESPVQLNKVHGEGEDKVLTGTNLKGGRRIR